jgi:hypothetical protein
VGFPPSSQSRLQFEHPVESPQVARLTVRRVHAPGERIEWQLCYGGTPIATGKLVPGDQSVVVALPEVRPSMDPFAFTLQGWTEDNDDVPIEATCSLAAYRLTQAEIVAHSLRPGAQDQAEVPRRGEWLVAESRTLSSPQERGDAMPDGARVQCRAVVYQDVEELLTRRRRRLLAGPASLTQMTR